MRPTALFFVTFLLIGVAAGADEAPIAADWVLRGGTVVDGTGAPRVAADVAIRGDRIVAVGRFEAGPGARVVDAAGWIVAPGFIDLHTHSDGPIRAATTRSNLNYRAQGVTTIVTGNCGSGPIDVGAYFRAIEDGGAGTNVIHLVPHGDLRRAVLGEGDHRADPRAMRRMEELLERGLRAGAWGMSTGLIYLPGRFADTAELVALARVVARHGGIYASHIRDEGAGLLGAIDEALIIGREAGVAVHISHLKASGRANWGQVVPACARIAAARAEGRRVSADQYPYVASSTSLAAMVVPTWARLGSARDFATRALDPQQGPRLRREIGE
ncbi:MAG TPA: amidohydrolase family protein, partial [Isosphaeraceae bacterium]